MEDPALTIHTTSPAFAMVEVGRALSTAVGKATTIRIISSRNTSPTPPPANQCPCIEALLTGLVMQ
ncbi:unnamed protein product [Schistocephalus solidus]|uniref:Alba domain-containing protein n=1 Tax=Schistocephalus solidus TaxID=70667 RepID=A0A183TQS2_SCHSO|nr:unnamed protein product [Schistocephalus solidus]